MTEISWEPLFGARPGLRYFREVFRGQPWKIGRIALADNSGDTPDDTDDGPIFLDFTRPIQIGTDEEGTWIHVPVKNGAGVGLIASETIEQVCVLVTVYGMALRIKGHRYRLQRCSNDTED